MAAMGRLISTDALESTISELVTIVRTQSSEISALKSTVARLEAAAAPAGTAERVAATLGTLDRRVEELCRAVTLPSRCVGDEYGAPGAAIGAVVATHERRLAMLERRAAGDDAAAGRDDSLVTVRALRETRTDVEAKLAAAVGRLTEGCASRAALAALQRSQEACLAQASATQALLAAKVDRAEVSRLEALTADLGSLEGWRHDVDRHVQQLQDRAEDSRRGADAALDSLSRLSSVVQGIAGSIATKADE